MAERLYFLDSLRAIAIVMVVGVHSMGYNSPLEPNQQQIILFIVHTVAVPIFFLVDGYLLTRSIIESKRYSYKSYIESSFLRLVVPWVIFTVIYTMLRYVFELSGFFAEHVIVGHSFQEVLINAYGSVNAGQMYFLISLFLIRVIAPFMVKQIIKLKYSIGLLLSVCFFIICKLLLPIVSQHLQIVGGQEPITHAFWGIQFFILGVIVFKTSLIKDLRKLFYPFVIVFIGSLFIRYKFNCSVLDDLIQYLYLITLFLFFSLFQSKILLLDAVGKNTMGIYLIHAPVVLKCVALIVTKKISNPLISYFGILFGTLLVTMIIVTLINNIPYGRILFGTPCQSKNCRK